MPVADHALLSSSLRGNRHAAAASARGPWPHSLACVPFGGRGVHRESGKAAVAASCSPVPHVCGGAVAKASLSASYEASVNKTFRRRRVLSGLAAIAAAARSAQFNAPGAESDTSLPLACAAPRAN
jgi:hypothetical protein